MFYRLIVHIGILLWSSTLFANQKINCRRVEFRYLKKTVEIKKDMNICSQNGLIVSEDCIDGECGLLKNRETEIKYYSYGNPSHLRCSKIGGLPVIGGVYKNNKKIRKNQTLCFDRKMKSFVDIKLIKSKRQKKGLKDIF